MLNSRDQISYCLWPLAPDKSSVAPALRMRCEKSDPLLSLLHIRYVQISHDSAVSDNVLIGVAYRCLSVNVPGDLQVSNFSLEKGKQSHS